MKRIIDAVRSRFLWKYSLANMVLFAAFNIVQWGLAIYVFTGGDLGIATKNMGTSQLIFMVIGLIALFVGWAASFLWVGKRFIKPLDLVVESVKAACRGTSVTR